MRTETCLWGVPRIHGEWLKLGIAVSERTVSRYLPRPNEGAVANVADIPEEPRRRHLVPRGGGVLGTTRR